MPTLTGDRFQSRTKPMPTLTGDHFQRFAKLIPTEVREVVMKELNPRRRSNSPSPDAKKTGKKGRKFFGDGDITMKEVKPFRSPSDAKAAGKKGHKGRKGFGDEAMTDEQSSNPKLFVKNIPPKFNNTEALERHFKRFGEVVEVHCNPIKKTADVLFQTKDEAAEAKKSGQSISKSCKPMFIQWFTKSSSDDTPAISGEDSSSSAMKLGFGTPKTEIEEAPIPVAQTLVPLAASFQDVGGGNMQMDPMQQLMFSERPPVEAPSFIEPAGRTWTHQRPLIQYDIDYTTGDMTHTNTRKKAPADQEYLPTLEDLGQIAQDNVEDVFEGEDEGPDSVLVVNQKMMEDADRQMDTIARVVTHPYYLRSLEQPASEPSAKLARQEPKKSSETRPNISQGASETKIPKGILSERIFGTASMEKIPRGVSAEKMFQMLDERDKEIRKNLTRNVTLAEAKTVVGTCPDMCPVKERYWREARRTLSVYEIDANSTEENPRVDHNKAIKEYSRAAADKDEPLPHELRPLPVLMKTMDYLAVNILDSDTGTSSEWYNFLWSRTRAIIVDIIQQQLCETDCALLIERCARFYILAAILLCGEDVTVFDPKLNLDNLTRCLQSLKELYLDLRVQKGVVCPNEAEFCCYDILLHLTEGNVREKVYEYSEQVRDSAPVRFALSCIQAVDESNYVRFFKLVREASYLQASLLYRYFNQVRLQALKTINRSYSGPKRPMQFSLETLTRILAFSSVEEAEEFCVATGRVVTGGEVELVRSSPVEVEDTLPALQSYDLMSSKNALSCGEVVYGGPVPHVVYGGPVPHIDVRVSDVPDVQSRDAGEVPEIIGEAETLEIADSLVEELIDEYVFDESRALAEMIFELCLETEEEIHEEVDSWLPDVVTLECRDVASSCFQTAWIAQENEIARKAAIDTVHESLLHRVVDHELRQSAEVVIRDAQIAAEAHNRVLNGVAQVLLKDIAVATINEVAMEALYQAKEEQQKHFRLAEKKMRVIRARRYWNRWRWQYRVRKHIRHSTSDFPPTGPLVPLPHQLNFLLTPKQRSTHHRHSFSPTQRPEQNTPRKDTIDLVDRLEDQRKEMFTPLDMCSLLHPLLRSSRIVGAQPREGIPISWYLLLVRPDVKDLTPQDHTVFHWLSSKLGLASSKDLDPSHQLQAMTSSVTSIPQQLNMMVKSCSKRSLGCHDNHQELKGVAATLIFLRSPSSEDSPESYSEDLQETLHLLRSILFSTYSELPVTVLVPTDLQLSFYIRLRRDLGVQGETEWPLLQFDSLESDMKMVHSYPQEKLSKVLVRLAMESTPQPAVVWATVQDIIEKALYEHFFPYILEDVSARQKASLPSQSPQPMVALYNHVLDYVVELLTSPAIVNLSWPVKEFAKADSSPGQLPFDWNEAKHLAQVEEHILSLKLPPAPQDSGLSSWSAQCQKCLDYVHLITQMDVSLSGQSVSALSRVKALLHGIDKDLDNKSLADSIQLGWLVPWDRVIYVCVELMLDLCRSHLRAGVLLDPEGRWLTAEFRWPLEWHAAVADTMTEQARPMESRRCGHFDTAPGERQGKNKRRRSDSEDSFDSCTEPVVHVPAPARDSNNLRGRVITTAILYEASLSKSYEDDLQRWLAAGELTALSGEAEEMISSPPHDSHVQSPLSLREKMETLESELRATRAQDRVDEMRTDISTFQPLTSP